MRDLREIRGRRGAVYAAVLLGSAFVYSDAGAQIASSAGAAPDSVDTYLEPYNVVEGSWFVGQYPRDRFAVEILGVRTAAECEQETVTFTYFTNMGTAAASPEKTVHAQWSMPETAQQAGICWAWTQWRLGDVPGEQVMQARIVRKEGRVATNHAAAFGPVEFTAQAHAMPALILGFAYLEKRVSGVTETDEDERARKEARLQPIVGVDFPVLTRLLPAADYPIFDHLRFMLATSFGDPGFDLYSGIELFPMSGPRAGGLPLQISVGRRWGIRSNHNWFVAGHFNASGAIASALTGLGLK